MKVSKASTRKKMTMKEFAHLVGVNYRTFHFRVRSANLSLMEAATISEAALRRASNTSHGYHGTPTYRAWEGMHTRCKSHEHYLRLGITVCERWNSFENFLADMGERPAEGTLDRIDGKNGYLPNNCRWCSMKEQSRNTSRNINITAYGKTQCIAAWAEELGMNENTINQRLKRGYSPETALSAKHYARVTDAR